MNLVRMEIADLKEVGHTSKLWSVIVTVLNLDTLSVERIHKNGLTVIKLI